MTARDKRMRAALNGGLIASFQRLGHPKMRSGEFDVEFFSEFQPPQPLVELCRRHAGVAPELIRESFGSQRALGELKHSRADSLAAKIIAHRHPAMLPGGLILTGTA